MEDVRNEEDIKLVTTDKEKNKLVPGPNYHTNKYFSEKLLAIKMKKKCKNEQACVSGSVTSRRE